MIHRRRLNALFVAAMLSATVPSRAAENEVRLILCTAAGKRDFKSPIYRPSG